MTGIDDREAYPIFRYLVLALVTVTLLTGVAVTLLGRSIARRSLHPLNALGTRIASIEPGDGQRAMSGTCLAELQAVVVRFDSLLDRFDETLSRERRFAALASHELRTPLTHARAEIEAICEGSDHRAGVERSIRAIDHLTELVDALLWFAKAQERLEPSHLEVVNLADLVRAELALMVPATAIDSQLPEEALVSGDERLLARVVANLLDNARKYGNGEPVNVTLQCAGEHLELEVSNAGKIAVADTERLFEPFYRQPGGASLAPALARVEHELGSERKQRLRFRFGSAGDGKFRAALADANTLVFDARPEAEFAVSHGPGAHSVPGKRGLSDAQYTADASRVIQMVPDRGRQLVLYCNGPFCGRSRRFAAELRNAGYKNVWRYQLGIPTWRALGGATQTERDALLAADHTAVLVDARESSAAVPALLSAKRIALADTTRAKDDGRLPMTDHNTRIFVVGDNAAQAQAVAEAIAKDAFHNVSFFAGGVAQLPELAAPSSVPVQAGSAR